MPKLSKNDLLIVASKEGDINKVKLLLNKQVDVNYVDYYRFTALMEASIHGHIDIVKLLLEHNADVNIRNKTTALIEASYNGYTDIVKVLLENGANVNHIGDNGRTALIQGCQKGHMHIVELLLQYGANIEYENNDESGNTALFYAIHFGHFDIVKLLLQYGVDVNHANNELNTPLIEAGTHNHINIVRLLLENGADVNYINDSGDTPLISVSYNGHSKVVELLLQYGAEVNHVNAHGNTALIEASGHTHIDLVGVLLDHGANVDHANNGGKTALIVSYNIDNPDNNSTHVINLLIEYGATINHTDRNGNNILSNIIDGLARYVLRTIANTEETFLEMMLIRLLCQHGASIIYSQVLKQLSKLTKNNPILLEEILKIHLSTISRDVFYRGGYKQQLINSTRRHLSLVPFIDKAIKLREAAYDNEYNQHIEQTVYEVENKVGPGYIEYVRGLYDGFVELGTKVVEDYDGNLYDWPMNSFKDFLYFYTRYF